MRLVSAIVALFTVVAPATAFACMNSIARHFETYPLDFAHFGIVAAALILLRWPKTETGDAALEPDDLDGDREEASVTSEPSMVRQLTILATFVVAGVGFGFFGAKVISFELTALLGRAALSAALVATAIGLSGFTRFAALRKTFRRGLLLVAMVISMVGSLQAYDGYTSEPGSGFQPANEEVMQQVNF